MPDPGTDTRHALEEIVGQALPKGLPRGWPEDSPLRDAGLDSVAVLQIVAELLVTSAKVVVQESLGYRPEGNPGAGTAIIVRLRRIHDIRHLLSALFQFANH